MIPLIGEVTQARMQDPAAGDGAPAAADGAARCCRCRRRGRRPGAERPGPADRVRPESVQPAGGHPAAGRPAADRRPGAAARRRARAASADRPGPPPGQPPVGAGEPPGTFPSIPGMNMTNVGPDRNDPFPNRSFADIVTSVEEAPTGRFMIGVGANSFQGLMGSISIYEKNFDMFNSPDSLSDITNGKAFRGGGQEFRSTSTAGTLINLMQVSLREPYLFDLPIGAGVSGYLFQRIYPNWDERRGGGRFTWAARSAP